MLALAKTVKDEGEVDGSQEHRVEFVVAGKHMAVAFQATKESLDLVAAAVELAIKPSRASA